jgi:DNA-binding response OmpR family regulator
MNSPDRGAVALRRRILLIEDDLSIAELERDYLEAAGFCVDIESDGASGLRRAIDEEGSKPFDMFVVDLMLPGADGFSICRELRSRTEKPILVVSARSADSDKVRALGIGADDFVTKPFSPAELVARAKAHMERYDRLRGGGEDSVIISGDLVIDMGKKSVTASGKLAPLTATEYSILAILAKSPDRIFSREEIFEKIRGEGVYGEVSTVTVHVRRLREKIETDPSNPQHIETVWGMGYRFVG